MTYVTTWADVVTILSGQPWRTRLKIDKGILPHPLEVGMTVSGGMPEGQLADFRFLLDEGSGFHVKDFGQHYEAHLDEVHPDVDIVEHLRQDAPGVYVGGSAALGAALGGLIGKGWKGALAGAALGALLGAMAAAAAEQDDHTRPKP